MNTTTTATAAATRSAWLASLKPGDEVLIVGGSVKVVDTIDQITPTRMIRIGEARFNRRGERKLTEYRSERLEPRHSIPC